MGRVKDWMMDMQDNEIEALLAANPAMTVEEAHELVCGGVYTNEPQMENET
jgi:hypothetical protein